jgi:hypothetical protein
VTLKSATQTLLIQEHLFISQIVVGCASTKRSSEPP